jgi:hypothetical protein
MPRSPRLADEHARHPVLNRSARRAPIFHSDDDCQASLNLLAERPTRFGAKVHGWALIESSGVTG